MPYLLFNASILVLAIRNKSCSPGKISDFRIFEIGQQGKMNIGPRFARKRTSRFSTSSFSSFRSLNMEGITTRVRQVSGMPSEKSILGRISGRMIKGADPVDQGNGKLAATDQANKSRRQESTQWIPESVFPGADESGYLP